MTKSKTLSTTGASEPQKARPKQTRADQLKTMLARKTGASVSQIQKRFNWQPHTARAAISSLRKAGHEIERSDTDKGSVYRIVSLGGAQ